MPRSRQHSPRVSIGSVNGFSFLFNQCMQQHSSENFTSTWAGGCGRFCCTSTEYEEQFIAAAGRVLSPVAYRCTTCAAWWARIPEDVARLGKRLWTRCGKTPIQWHSLIPKFTKQVCKDINFRTAFLCDLGGPTPTQLTPNVTHFQ